MVIITFQYGRLGNKLLTYAHFLTNSLKYNYLLYNYDFHRHFKYFPIVNESNNTVKINKRDAIIAKCLSNNLIVRIINKIFKNRTVVIGNYVLLLEHLKSFDLNDEKYISLARTKTVFVLGWLYRDFTSIIEKKQDIIKLFQPAESLTAKIQSKFTELRSKYDVIIGVHIRRGDYKNYKEGMYFFEVDEYKEIIRNISNQINCDNKVLFYLTSNEDIPIGSSSDYQVFVAKGDFIEDLYSLANCDYLIGPLSSYSTWASYIGNVPIKHISRDNRYPELKDFKIHYL